MTAKYREFPVNGIHGDWISAYSGADLRFTSTIAIGDDLVDTTALASTLHGVGLDMDPRHQVRQVVISSWSVDNLQIVLSQIYCIMHQSLTVEFFTTGKIL